MWEQITREQIKDYPVGTKVLVSGEHGGDQECTITSHWSEGDDGFMVDRNIFTRTMMGSPVDDIPCGIFTHSSWDNHTVSVWVEHQ